MAYINIDVDINEVLSDLSSNEIQKLVDELYEDDGYFPTAMNDYIPNTDTILKTETLQDEDWNEVIRKLALNRLFLSVEEEEYIKQIAKKL